jgi:competence protein CoiA
MPLKAIVDGETIIGSNLTKEEWDNLRSQHKKGLLIKMGCCGAPGHLRISKKGTQHFYHAADVGCEWEHETLEHLEIKNQIYQICKSENWNTYAEHPASDRKWISDVYANKDGKTIVFEIQISKIPLAILEERDKNYRNEGIESYWLLNNYLEKSDHFSSEYNEHVYEEEDKIQDDIPYIDNSIFDTGPENHVFILKGIRTIGLNLKKQVLYTTENSEIKIEDWVKQVLKGNYKNYLDSNYNSYHQKHKLKLLAAPYLKQFNDFYYKIICDETFKANVDRYYRIYKTDDTLMKMKEFKKLFNSVYFESERLDKEYRAMVSLNYGLFIWEKPPWNDAEEPFFRLESESKINELKVCVEQLKQMEGFYNTVFHQLETKMKPLLAYDQEDSKISKVIKGKENAQSSTIFTIKDEISNASTNAEIPIRNPMKIEQISNKDNSNKKSGNIHYATFECALHLESNWLTHSCGMRFQVVPGLLSQLPEDVAKEFEQKEYGKILKRKLLFD